MNYAVASNVKKEGKLQLGLGWGGKTFYLRKEERRTATAEPGSRRKAPKLRPHEPKEEHKKNYSGRRSRGWRDRKGPVVHRGKLESKWGGGSQKNSGPTK